MAMKKGSGVQISKIKLPEDVVKAMGDMASSEVLVGFPAATTDRKKEPEDEAGAQELTNAALGYIHDNGAPEANIPARPFMVPGIELAKPKLLQIAKKMGGQVLTASDPRLVVEQGYHTMGLVAQAAIRGVINDGVDPPLSDATLRARAARGRKGAKQELANRAAGLPAGKTLAKPLVDTGQLRNAVNYAIRNRKKRGA
jgi:hypothetical protein